MSYTKIKNEFCARCKGSGRIPGPTINGSSKRECIFCDGLGYRVLYRDEDGCEFNCTIVEWRWKKKCNNLTKPSN